MLSWRFIISGAGRVLADANRSRVASRASHLLVVNYESARMISALIDQPPVSQGARP